MPKSSASMLVVAAAPCLLSIMFVMALSTPEAMAVRPDAGFVSSHASDRAGLRGDPGTLSHGTSAADADANTDTDTDTDTDNHLRWTFTQTGKSAMRERRRRLLDGVASFDASGDPSGSSVHGMNPSFLQNVMSGNPQAHTRSRGNPFGSDGDIEPRGLAPAAPTPADGFFNVLEYGAAGDNHTDNTAAFSDAMKAAAAAGGGVVIVPAGLYRFGGSISVPSGVSFRGTYASVPSHSMVAPGSLPPNDGSVLQPTAHRGDDTAEPFISVAEDASVSGFAIWYPFQNHDAVPVPYPYTVSLTGQNAAVMDVEVLNGWNVVLANSSSRHRISRVQGQALNIGVYIDNCFDIGRVYDVHFNPWWSTNVDLLSWTVTHGRAFVFGRSDWEYAFNLFAFGYAVGYHFIETAKGSTNGNFLGIGADYATNSSILVDASQAPGLLITNGEFTSFHTPQFAPNVRTSTAQVVVSASNTGPVRFVDSSFWGPSDSIAVLSGSGTSSFTSCEFVQWDLQYKNGTAAIRAYDGNLILSGNDFAMKGTQVELGPNVKRAVISGNVMVGPLAIVDNGAGNVQKGLNAFDP